MRQFPCNTQYGDIQTSPVLYSGKTVAYATTFNHAMTTVALPLTETRSSANAKRTARPLQKY